MKRKERKKICWPIAMLIIVTGLMSACVSPGGVREAGNRSVDSQMTKEVDKAGAQFKRWIGGHYEQAFSCNPVWEPNFTKFPEHPITRGVQPFQIKDEWYMNIRFVDGFGAEGAKTQAGVKFTPILVAAPSDAVRNGPYVWPAGPYPHIQANKGRDEAMMWAIERPDGGRGFGFTGGHFHDNWGDDNFRRTILNALLWVAKAEVPKAGVASTVAKADLDANLDAKKK